MIMNWMFQNQIKEQVLVLLESRKLYGVVLSFVCVILSSLSERWWDKIFKNPNV